MPYNMAGNSVSFKEKDQKLLAGAVKSASYNMILQLMLRVLTFGINAFILRFISKDMLGVVNVRLTLLYSTTLFLATEAFDKACLIKLESQKWSKIINLMWCTIPASIIVSIVLDWIWISVLEKPDANIVAHYNLGVLSFTMSTVLVIVSRPLYIVGQKCMFVKLKVISAGMAELCKSILTVIMVLYLPHLGLINFAVAQVVYGLVMSGIYYGYFVYYIKCGTKDDGFPFSSVRQLFPSHDQHTPFIDVHQKWLTVSIFTQSFLKQILTEGEKYVMTVFGVLSFADQGIYDIINNLGSMAARFIFKPLEESGYLFFSQLLERGKPHSKQNQDSLKLSAEVLRCLLLLVVLIGATISVFGIPYSYLALDLYGGKFLSSGSGPNLMRWYGLYVLFIAINGITECFVFATMSKLQVDRYNQMMVLFSIVFLVSTLFLTLFVGGVGFILANCLNMMARIIHSIVYIEHYFKGSDHKPLHAILPSGWVILTYIVSLFVTLYSEYMFCCEGILNRLLHIGVGGLCLCLVICTVYFKETNVIQFLKDRYHARNKY